MNKKDLIKKLEAVYGSMENFQDDCAMSTMMKEFDKLKDELSDVISELENESDE